MVSCGNNEKWGLDGVATLLPTTTISVTFSETHAIDVTQHSHVRKCLPRGEGGSGRGQLPGCLSVLAAVAGTRWPPFSSGAIPTLGAPALWVLSPPSPAKEPAGGQTKLHFHAPHGQAADLLGFWILLWVT